MPAPFFCIKLQVTKYLKRLFIPKAPFNMFWQIVLDQPFTFVVSQLFHLLTFRFIEVLTICSKSSTSNTSSIFFPSKQVDCCNLC